ncbi:tape measure protein [Sphingobacterium sp. SGG-5]|uniref:tape measure protein n=1 Tax=Sphingobacterium sp. SGG-5 TaxID=2710881 RepID=UPI0013EC295C|nr:tape measure protein [Sphingobacterium sp. SGG-5]NGM63515.1 tape measure protein [Sphingobacterium sp. SGG-5]
MARLEIEVMAKGISGLLSDIDKVKEAAHGIKGIKLDISGSGGQSVAKTLQDAKIATEEARAEGIRLNNVLKEQRIEQGKAASSIASATSAYRQLSNELNANRNNAKNLAADMFRLEQSGQKNTTAYRNLEQQFKRVQTTTNTLDTALKKIDGSLGQHQRYVGEYGRSFAGAIPYIDQFTTAAGLIATAVASVRQSFQTNLKFDAIEYSLKVLSGSAGEFETNLSFLRIASDRLGIDFLTMTDAFKKWQGAVAHSNLTAEQSRKIFESVANAGAKMKLSTDEIQGTFLALSQMLSKGVVSMEELRRQLGDRLPGAFAIAAKSMGMTETEFNKLVASGSLMAEDFLPKFAAQLDIAFGNDKTKRIDSMQAATARLGNEWDRLWRSEGATTFFSSGIGGLANLLKAVNSNSDALRDLTDESARSKDSFVSTYNKIKDLSTEYDTLTTKTKLNKEEQERLRDVIRDLGELLPASVTQWDKYGRALDLNKSKVNEMTSEFIKLRKEQQKSILSGLNKEFSDTDKSISSLRKNFGMYEKQLETVRDKMGTGGNTKELESVIQTRFIVAGEKLNEKLERQKTIVQAIIDEGGKLTKSQLDFYNAEMKSVQSSIAVGEELVKNKGYWESIYKTQKDILEKLPKNNRTAEENAIWENVVKNIEFAKKQIDAYTSSTKTATGVIRDFVKEIQNIYKSDTDIGNLVGLYGLDRDIQTIKNRYQKMLDEVNALESKGLEKNKKNESEKTKIIAEAVKERTDITVAMENEISQKKIEFAEKTANKIAELESRAGLTRIKSREQELAADKVYWDKIEANAKDYGITSEQITELRKASEARINADWDTKMFDTSLDLQRRFNETSIQREFRRITDEFKIKEKGLNDFVAQLRADGKTQEEIAQALADKKEKIQEDYYKKIEELTKKQREIDIQSSFDGKLFTEGIKQVDSSIEELRMSFQALNNEEIEQFKTKISDLTAEREVLGLFQETINEMGAAFTNLAVDSLLNAEDAMENFGKMAEGIVKSVVAGLIKIGVQYLISQALAKAGSKATLATAITTAGAISAAYATPAALVSAATFGGNVATGATALAAFVAATNALAVAKPFKSGGYTGNVGINDVAGIVHGKEFVVNADGTRKNMALLQAMNRGIDVSSILGDTGVSLSKSAPISMAPLRVDVFVHGELSGDVIKLVKDEADRDFYRYYGR